jgi:hypothetical protein
MSGVVGRAGSEGRVGGGRLAADGKRNEKRIKNPTELLGLSGRADRENI